MTTLLFYKNPIPLNAALHRDARLRVQPNDFRFAACTNAVPLAAVEFFDAAREYPVVFAGQENGAVFPVAMVGARNDENLFVGADGRWDARYVPAFARRYPFVLAETRGDDNLKVYIDQAYEGFGVAEGERLFSPQGEPTPILDYALSFRAPTRARSDGPASSSIA